MPLRYRFGRSTLLPDTRQLLLDDAPLLVGARALDLLVCLIEHKERVVEKDELMQRVWPGSVVGDNNNNTRSWELLGPWRGAVIRQPAMFIAGARDSVLRFAASRSQIDNFGKTLPGLRDCRIVDGATYRISLFVCVSAQTVSSNDAQPAGCGTNERATREANACQ